MTEAECYKLTATPTPHPPVLLGEERSKKDMNEVKPRKKSLICHVSNFRLRGVFCPVPHALHRLRGRARRPHVGPEAHCHAVPAVYSCLRLRGGSPAGPAVHHWAPATRSGRRPGGLPSPHPSEGKQGKNKLLMLPPSLKYVITEALPACPFA